MTSREIILRAINFQGPERIGMTFSGGRMDDLVYGSPARRTYGAAEGARVEGNMEVYEDEWGNTWHRLIGMSKGGEVRDPVLRDWSQLDGLKLPDYADPARYEAMTTTFSAAPDKYRLAGLPGFPFAIMRYMRKMEVFLEDVIMYRDEVLELQRRVVEVIKQAMRGGAQAGADGVFYCEDWGTQERLLVSPKMWRELFKPGYKALLDEAKRLGLAVWMHSCGCITDIIEDLIEVGIKVLQFDQPELHGVDTLKNRFGGRVAFWTPVDIQKTMQTGDKAKIRAAAKDLCEKLGGFKGGFIAKNYGDLHGIGVDPEWDRWAYEAFVEFGRYR